MSRVAELLAELIRLPTQQANTSISSSGGPGDELALCEHLATLLRALGPDDVTVGTAPRTDGSPGAYVFARWGTPRRIINAHVDTVPANAGWSRDPWQPYIDGGRLYGLGSADTKGAIAATLVALDGLAPRDVGVLFSGDEEAGSRVMEAFLATPHAHGIREVIVCEPTAHVAGTMHRGIIGQRATMLGPGGHSSKADHRPKPLAQLARLAASLDDYARTQVDVGPAGMTGTCLNIAALQGGVAFNVIPARGVLEWSIRPYPGFDRDAWDREVASRAAAIDPAITVEDIVIHHPFGCDVLTDLVRPFAARVGSLDFWTEAAMWQTHGADAIVIGPGDIAQAHAADEWVPLEDLDWAVEMYRALLSR